MNIINRGLFTAKSEWRMNLNCYLLYLHGRAQGESKKCRLNGYRSRISVCRPKNAYWTNIDLEWECGAHTERMKVWNKSLLTDLRILFNDWIESAKSSCELSLKDKFKWSGNLFACYQNPWFGWVATYKPIYHPWMKRDKFNRMLPKSLIWIMSDIQARISSLDEERQI